MEIAGRKYACVQGSDLIRDGMFLELSETDGIESRLAMEVFYSDETGKMVVTAFQNEIPLPAVEWVISSAKRLLPPESDSGEGARP